MKINNYRAASLGIRSVGTRSLFDGMRACTKATQRRTMAHVIVFQKSAVTKMKQPAHAAQEDYEAF
jgi:hypothetical protein